MYLWKWKIKNSRLIAIFSSRFSWKLVHVFIHLYLLHVSFSKKCHLWDLTIPDYLRREKIPWRLAVLFNTLTLKSDWLLISTGIQEYHSWIKCKGHKNKANNHLFKQLLIFLVGTIRNVEREQCREHEF